MAWIIDEVPTGAAGSERFMDLIDIHVPEDEGQSLEVRPRRLHRSHFRLTPTWWFVIVAIVATVLPFVISAIHKGGKISVATSYMMTHGYYGMTEAELKKIVTADHLTVFWLGPRTKAKYALDASNLDQISIRYLPNGLGATNPDDKYLVVETYVAKNAFATVLNAGNSDNGVSFINIDGNSVYYNRLNPKNVYVGIKGKDFQVEIYDPRVDQALALAITKSSIVQIK